MTPAERLAKATRIFLDTAPVIYWVERHPSYADIVRGVLDRVDAGALLAVTSPVTLAECLVHPLRANRPELAQAFTDLITAGPNTLFASVDRDVACRAAELRARHGVTLADAFQLAVAAATRCDIFLTNDAVLARVPDVDVVVLRDLAPPAQPAAGAPGRTQGQGGAEP